jgi:hypothetical protein
MRAFTLIETLIYIGLLALIMSAAFAATVSITGSAARNRSDAFLEEQGQFLIGKIEQDLASGSSSDFSLVNGSLIVTHGGSVALTGNDVSVQNVSFSTVVATGTIPAHVDVSLKLAATTTTGTLRTQTFSTTYYESQ